ncbi:EAL domain-containing protein [Paenibacillus sp. PR3]|uniref:EAL domain-containing protein n=1 Tax=Paenibacillus terricola TaxID=2763503 RepID=A0ABR8N485_9BACL|nr:bifunctional diguanylate cyclase/phosphodiesterase [Paenibacillus terricola]MBD3922973.1 EAL domain-containing protein [Paenibacillus terricola]
MKLPQSWVKRLVHITPNIVIVISTISLSMNMANSVSTSRGLVSVLAFAVFIFAALLVKKIPLKYVFASIAFLGFYIALQELSFDGLISVMYLTLVLLAFLLPSPLPTFLAATYYIYYMPSFSPEVPMEMIRNMLIGVIINTILYSLLAFYFRNLKRENEINLELNVQLNDAFNKLEYRAYHDMLTQLPNRDSLKKQMEEQLFSDAPLAVLFIDLDHFKNVNDMMGHNAGDRMLLEVTDHLKRTIGQNNFIARYAGDEFVLLCPFERVEQVEQLAKQIIHSFRTPFQIDQKPIYTTPSIGISLYPADSLDADTLIQYADKAMYEVKSSEKNGYRFFSAIASEELLRQVKLENDLRCALIKQEFAIYYQPLVEMSTGRIRGVEALLRWTHSELGAISPAEFIPLAEQTGVIVDLGEWVLEEACRQVKSWQRAGRPDLTLAVNISIRQFKSDGFASKVLQIVENTDFNPELLELEVTESMMQNMHESIVILDELKRQGVKISIDDFGTGYSSLSVLRQLPVDTLKIDRSFTKELMTESSAASIVKLIIDIGHNLNLKIICEGIEKPQEIGILREYGCEIGQGYYYYRPSPSEEIGLLLHSARPV